eukprot:gene12559-16746_t
MLSGIGDAGHLKNVGIEPIVAAKAVGRNLQDHIAVSYFYKVRTATLNDLLHPIVGKIRAGLRYMADRAGRCTSTPANRPLRGSPRRSAISASALEKDDDLARTFFARVRVLQYGGASLAQSIIDRVQAVAIRTIGERVTFATGYGSTETGPTACNIHWLNGRGGMIGLPVPGTAVKLVPAGEKFEIRVKGPQISPGYLGEPQLSADAFDDEGFYRLGDAARAIDPANPEAGLMFDGRRPRPDAIAAVLGQKLVRDAGIVQAISERFSH